MCVSSTGATPEVSESWGMWVSVGAGCGVAAVYPPSGSDAKSVEDVDLIPSVGKVIC